MRCGPISERIAPCPCALFASLLFVHGQAAKGLLCPERARGLPGFHLTLERGRLHDHATPVLLQALRRKRVPHRRVLGGRQLAIYRDDLHEKGEQP